MRQLKIAKQVTSRDTASLDKYLQEVSKISLLNADDEITLAQRIKAGDREAFEQLTLSNLRFVISVSKQYQNQGLSLSDLIAEGNIGLMKAVKKFDETKGFKFISYAVWWIRQTVMQAIAEQSRLVRLPLNKVGVLSKMSKIAEELEQIYQREANAAEIASKLKISEEEVEEAKALQNKHVSMDAPLPDNDEYCLSDIIINPEETLPEEHLMKESLQIEIARLLAKLTPREADIIRLYYGLDGKQSLSIHEIAAKFDLTCERVRQIKEKALKKLKSDRTIKLLRTYL